MERMRNNRTKNANQICDEIYQRQYLKLKKDYHLQRKKVANKEKAETFQQKKLAKLEKRVNKQFLLDNSMQRQEYSGFTELLNKSVIVDERKVTDEKLRGNY